MKKDKKPSIRFKEFTEAWEQRKLDEISKITMGQSPDSINYTDNNDDTILIQGNADLDNGKVIPRIYTKQITKTSKPNDIIFTVRAPVGEVARNSYNAVIGRGVASITGNNFLYHTLKRLNEINYWNKLSAGSTFDSINSDQLKSIEIDLPNKDEQKVIGNFFEKIDNLITLHQRKYDKLVCIKKSLLEKMFPQNGKNIPEIRFKEFTEAWEQRKLGEYGDFTYGHSAPKWSVTSDAKTPCVRYGELYTKFGVKIDKVFSYTNMPKNKLVFSKGNEVLIPRVGEDPYDYNHCTWLSMPNVAIGEMISIYYTKQNPLFTAIMYNATLRNEFAIRVEGGSVTNLYYDKLKDIDVSFPNKEEQEKISTFFYKIDNLITLHQCKLEKLKNLKKSLLNKMFV